MPERKPRASGVSFALIYNSRVMKKIESIVLVRKPDYDADVSYLGEFSDEAGEYAIEHSEGERGSYKYFNADNVENMQDAEKNYRRMVELERGNWCMYAVYAKAEVRTSSDGNDWLCNTVRSGGLYGIESDSGEAYFEEIERDAMVELVELLGELGFTPAEIRAVKVTPATL